MPVWYRHTVYEHGNLEDGIARPSTPPRTLTPSSARNTRFKPELSKHRQKTEWTRVGVRRKTITAPQYVGVTNSRHRGI
jgi:hypothetical protein